MSENSVSGSPPVQAEDLASGGFFGALARRQSYLNIAYLLLSFPLGIAYFVFIMTGLSLGCGLLILFVGLFVLLFLFVGIRGLAALERQLAGILLGVEIPAPDSHPPVWNHPLITLKRYLTDAYSWKCLSYFLIKFPLSIASFVAALFFISFTLTLLLTPLLYPFVPVHVIFWRILTAEQALVCALIGLLTGVIAVHAMNGLAAIHRALAAGLLAGSAMRHEPLKTGPVIIP